MAAAARYGTLLFLSVVSGRRIAKDVYFSDIANALVRFDAGAGASASSETSLIASEHQTLIDFSVVTGMADTTKWQLTRDGVPTGDILRYAIHETTLANRPVLNIPFARGMRIGGIQLA